MRHRVGAFVNQAHKAGATLIYDPNFRKAHLHELNEMMPLLIENMSLASLVRGSNEDFAMIFGSENLDDVYKNTSKYCDNLIVTANSAGVNLITSTECAHYDVEEIQPVSTIGAGDNFNAGFITALYYSGYSVRNFASLSLKEWEKLIKMGVAFSADVCMSYDNYISDTLANSVKK